MAPLFHLFAVQYRSTNIPTADQNGGGDPTFGHSWPPHSTTADVTEPTASQQLPTTALALENLLKAVTAPRKQQGTEKLEKHAPLFPFTVLMNR